MACDSCITPSLERIECLLKEIALKLGVPVGGTPSDFQIQAMVRAALMRPERKKTKKLKKM